MATYTYFIKVVPTRYKYLYGTTVDSYQYSVTEHAKSVGFIKKVWLLSVMWL